MLSGTSPGKLPRSGTGQAGPARRPGGAEERRRRCMGAYLGALWRCRYFWLSLVKMDLRTRYRGSVLGMGWSLLQPVAMTIILCTVFHKLFQTPVRDYSLFLISGLTAWNFVLNVTLQGCQALFHAEAYI